VHKLSFVKRLWFIRTSKGLKYSLTTTKPTQLLTPQVMASSWLTFCKGSKNSAVQKKKKLSVTCDCVWAYAFFVLNITLCIYVKWVTLQMFPSLWITFYIQLQTVYKYFVCQASFITSCRFLYCINIGHSFNSQHARQSNRGKWQMIPVV